ncbi:Zinc finger-like protein [Quillaja saponaria]|uniref:Zinc finger-like protein n=1 Tax=Quillaja saponaria TaxID=32244 RepID=A0AAD7VDQ9_QUISA|nr:Zinc finger-like protein [Quillaja saponaria]
MSSHKHNDDQTIGSGVRDKGKEKVNEEPVSIPEFIVSNGDMVSESKHEQNLICFKEDSPKASNSPPDESSLQKAKKEYICSFCKNEYDSSQALAGHQNAHRMERKLVMKKKAHLNSAKWKQSAKSPSLHRKFDQQHLHMHVSPPLRQPLNENQGVQMQSVISRPSYQARPPITPGFGFENQFQPVAPDRPLISLTMSQNYHVGNAWFQPLRATSFDIGATPPRQPFNRNQGMQRLSMIRQPSYPSRSPVITEFGFGNQFWPTAPVYPLIWPTISQNYHAGDARFQHPGDVSFNMRASFHQPFNENQGVQMHSMTDQPSYPSTPPVIPGFGFENQFRPSMPPDHHSTRPTISQNYHAGNDMFQHPRAVSFNMRVTHASGNVFDLHQHRGDMETEEDEPSQIDLNS